MKIAFDLDGVFYDMSKILDEFMSKKGYDVDKTQYNLAKRYNVTEEESILFLNEFIKEDTFLKIPLIKKAKETFLELSKENEIYIITYRHWAEHGIRDTILRLYLDNIPVKLNNIIFTKEKGAYAMILGIDLFYEDCLDNAIDIRDNSDAKVIIVDNDYNKSVDFERVKW